MQMLGRRPRACDERGAAALEFALVVPILLLVIVGIVNFGVVFAQQISLDNGARQAARYAVVDGRTCGQVKDEGRKAAETVGMQILDGTVPTPAVPICPSDAAKPCTGATPGTNVTVTMTRTGAANAWIVTMPPFNVIPVPTVKGTGVMRCEYS